MIGLLVDALVLGIEGFVLGSLRACMVTGQSLNVDEHFITPSKHLQLIQLGTSELGRRYLLGSMSAPSWLHSISLPLNKLGPCALHDSIVNIMVNRAIIGDRDDVNILVGL